jgi:hypothetical protein
MEHLPMNLDVAELANLPYDWSWFAQFSFVRKVPWQYGVQQQLQGP